MAIDDKYTYPHSNGVLKNKFNIVDSTKLSNVETSIVLAKYKQIKEETANLDGIEKLRRIHKIAFEDIYTWAGEFRTVNTANGALPSCLPEYLEDNLNILEKRMKNANYLRASELPTEDLVHEISEIWGELTVLHPFRDGNTRTQTLFVSDLFEQNGIQINWANINHSKLNDSRLKAAIFDTSMMEEVLNSNIIHSQSRLPNLNNLNKINEKEINNKIIKNPNQDIELNY